MKSVKWVGIYCSFNQLIFPDKKDMEPGYEIKTLIHHVLHRHNIYKLEIGQLQEVLLLLEEGPSEEPIDIQQKIFRGIVHFNNSHRDEISAVLSKQKYQQVSFDVKSVMHKVLHEFNFLNSIKAWEMFMPQFQQPGLPSEQNNSQGELNDQLEKAKLHYLYYGPMSVYHYNSQMPQQQQQFDGFQAPPPFDYGRPERRFEIEPRPPRGRPPNSSKNKNNAAGGNSKAKVEANKTLGEPRDKIKTGEKVGPNDAVVSNQGHPSSKMDIQSPENSLINCLCHGQSQSDKIFKCKCERVVHAECVGDNKQCLTCRQSRADPYVRVISLVKSFIIDWDKTDRVEGYVNLVEEWSACCANNQEIIVNCAHPSISGLVWPDDALLKINDQKVLQTPALLQAHSQARRKDRSLAVTPYVASFAHAGPSSLEQLKFSLEVKPSEEQNGLARRNNRVGKTQFCIFLAKQLTPNDVFKEVVEQNNDTVKKGPFEQELNEEVELDRFSITLFDPYSRELMDHPARGVNCKHFQCFDLQTFLKFTYSIPSREWKCPICRNDVQRLLIDNFQSSMLRDLKQAELFPKKIIFCRTGEINYEYNQTQQLQNQEKQKTE